MKFTKFNAKIQSSLSTIFNKYPLVRTIIHKIHEIGGTPYLVGGAVRDLILDVNVKDLDIEIHGLPLETIEKVLSDFGFVDMVGKSFGVLRISALDVDWSLPRADSVGRKPIVTIDPAMDIIKALRRRDLTMNAMAINLITMELVDPFGGLNDMQAKRLRTPDCQFFIEDPLRFYRVMQFIARFEMSPDLELNELCIHMNLRGVSQERISGEFEKIFLKSVRPSLGFRWIAHIDRLQELLPELGDLVGVAQDPGWHPEGDVFEHTMQVIDAAAQLTYKDSREKLIIMLAALCHDLGKATKTEMINGHLKSIGHAHASVEIAKRLLSRITMKKELTSLVLILVENHSQPLIFISENAGPAAYKRLAKKIAPAVTLEMLALLARADRRGRNPKKGFPLEVHDETDVDLFLERARKAFVSLQAELPILYGRDFLAIVSPGPVLGKLVDRAYALQIDQSIHDKDMLKKIVLEEYKAGIIK